MAGLGQTPVVNVWLPVATFILGFLAKVGTDWIQHRQSLKREREARLEQRRQRKADFQRQTLLDLQDAVQELGRTTADMFFEDLRAFQETGDWRKRRYSQALNQDNRAANGRTAVLAVRVQDRAIRELVQAIKAKAALAGMATDSAVSEIAMTEMFEGFEQLNKQIGERLRQIEDETLED